MLSNQCNWSSHHCPPTHCNFVVVFFDNKHSLSLVRKLTGCWQQWSSCSAALKFYNKQQFADRHSAGITTTRLWWTLHNNHCRRFSDNSIDNRINILDVQLRLWHKLCLCWNKIKNKKHSKRNHVSYVLSAVWLRLKEVWKTSSAELFMVKTSQSYRPSSATWNHTVLPTTHTSKPYPWRGKRLS